MSEFDVTEFPPTEHVEEGDRAPEFTRPLVTAEGWEDVALSELTAESRVLLVFYPMNGSGKSVYTWNEIRERGWGDGDLRVVGVSISQPYDQHAFVRRLEMDYALFADPANGVAAEYGVVHDLDGMTGVTEPRPSAFLLDTERLVEYAWVAEEWPELPPYDEIAAEL